MRHRRELLPSSRSHRSHLSSAADDLCGNRLYTAVRSIKTCIIAIFVVFYILFIGVHFNKIKIVRRAS